MEVEPRSNIDHIEAVYLKSNINRTVHVGAVTEFTIDCPVHIEVVIEFVMDRTVHIGAVYNRRGQ